MACCCLVGRLRHVKDCRSYFDAGLDYLKGEDVTHERRIGRFELNLVRVEFEVMLGEVIPQIDESVVMVPGGIC